MNTSKKPPLKLEQLALPAAEKSKKIRAVAMAKRGKRGGGDLSRFLDSHIQTITETFQMMEAAAAPTLEKAGWAEVTKLGDQVYKQATVAGMLWSGEAPGIEALKENIIAYFNVLQGFLLVCYGTTVGAGPTLHEGIHSAAKGVMDCSISLFREAVSAYESRSPDRKILIPQLTGTVWEACAALKKVPTTNCIAIGRAMTQIGICLKDVLREMKELPLGDSAVETADGSPSGVVDSASTSDKEELSTDLDLDDDFSPEEVAVARLVITVASDSLLVVKEVIRFITGLIKSSSDQSGSEEGKVEPMEKLLSSCREVADQVNDLAASVYPPQDVSHMKSVVNNLYPVVRAMGQDVGSLGGSPESAFVAIGRFKSSLGVLETELFGDGAHKAGSLPLDQSNSS